MVPGFKKRLLHEIKHIIRTNDEFETLRVHIPKFAIPDCIFAPNVCQWVGASLMISLNTREVDKFLMTLDQFNTNLASKTPCSLIPDRFGDAFMCFNRSGLFFNKQFELKLEAEKQQ